MITYAVTVVVPVDHAEAWQSWMQTVHITDVMASGIWKEARLHRVITPAMEAHVTFVTQYRCESYADYERYRDEFAPQLQAHHNELFGDKASATRALFEEIACFSA